MSRLFLNKSKYVPKAKRNNAHAMLSCRDLVSYFVVAIYTSGWCQCDVFLFLVWRRNSGRRLCEHAQHHSLGLLCVLRGLHDIIPSARIFIC